MNLQELIRARHSIRRFTDDDVPDEDILKILEAIRIGPSSENFQNWHFIVVKNRDFMNKLAAVIELKMQELKAELVKIDEHKADRFEKFIRNFTLFYLKAPVLLMIYSFKVPPAAYNEYKLLNRPNEDIEELFIQNTGMQGLGASIEHGVLTAIEMGYGSCHMTSQNWLHKDIEELVKKEIGFYKDNWFLAAMLPIGVPAGEPKSPSRKPLEEMLTFWK